jgi:hypothetical protein
MQGLADRCQNISIVSTGPRLAFLVTVPAQGISGLIFEYGSRDGNSEPNCDCDYPDCYSTFDHDDLDRSYTIRAVGGRIDDVGR